jgi:metal-sulfur cluster biosynthetic enzyme
MTTAAQPAPLTQATILAALGDCYHPELSLSIVALGAVESVALTPDPAAPGAGIPGVPARHRVQIVLVPPPAANEATNSQIAALIANRLAAFETISRTDVSFAASPAWTPDRISPAGRALLAERVASTQKHALIQIKT